MLEELNARLVANGHETLNVVANEYETVNVLDKENFNEVLGSLTYFEIAQLLDDENDFDLALPLLLRKLGLT